MRRSDNMECIMIKVNDKTIEKMKKFYASQMLTSTTEDVIFKAQIIGCTITAHLSKEIVFEGIRAKEACKQWTKAPVTKKKDALINEGPFLDKHIASDDVGHADYFGPICTVACYVDDKDIPWLQSLGIDDARTLPATEVVRIAKEIKDRVIYSLLILDNPHYNRMVKEGLNFANIKARLHNQAITNVMQRLDFPIETKVVEQFVAPKTYYNYLKNEVIVVRDLHFEKNTYSKYIAMACAHILARYASLQYFNNMSRSLKVKLPHGTSTQVDQVAIQLVQTRGENILNKVAKMNLSNTKRILEAVQQRV